jgi:hypothetical protein
MTVVGLEKPGKPQRMVKVAKFEFESRASRALLFSFQAMSVLEQLFGASVLEVAVPDTSLEYPPRSSTDEWLTRLSSAETGRKTAFFGTVSPPSPATWV